MEIPGLYETEGIPLNEKLIFQCYSLPVLGFYWLIAELDIGGKLAFGYAYLNNEQMAEWGYICVEELRKNGAVLVQDWEPVMFKDWKRRCCQ